MGRFGGGGHLFLFCCLESSNKRDPLLSVLLGSLCSSPLLREVGDRLQAQDGGGQG